MKAQANQFDLLRIPCREIKVWAWILVCTLIFNATFPAVTKSLFFSSSEKVLLCSTAGYKWVSVLTLEPTEKNKSHCLMCLNNDDSSAFFEPLISVLSQVQADKVAFDAQGFLILNSKFLLPRNRAPPVFSSS